MAKKVIKINSILGGHQRYYHQASENQFLTSIGIDPDEAVDYTNNGRTAGRRAGGAISPTAYANIATAAVDDFVEGLLTVPTSTSSLYAITQTRKLFEYDLLTSDTERNLAAVGGALNVNTAAYHNNFLYFFTNTDVSRFGPLSTDGPTITNNVWTGATLGSQTALTTMPAAVYGRNSNVPYERHTSFVHPADGRLYFCDIGPDNKGIINFIQTAGTSGTNDGSTYNALDLPPFITPYCIANLGTNLVIGTNYFMIKTSAIGVIGSRAALYIWDTISPSYSRVVPLPDPWVSALLNHNGKIYGWSGWVGAGNPNLTGFQRFWVYDGGYTVTTLFTAPSPPPRQSGVGAYGDRIMWTTRGRDPVTFASILAYGSNIGPFGGVQNIAQSNPNLTSDQGEIATLAPLRYLGDGSFYGNPALNIAFGGSNEGTFFINKKNTTTTNYTTSYWRSKVYNIGKTFSIKSVRMGLANYTSANAANQSFVLTAYFDDEATSQAATTFNSTNFPADANGGPYFVIFKEDDFSGAANGRQNFFLELKFTGTKKLDITLPIEIELDVSDNEML